jgi:hypothetical protein
MSKHDVAWRANDECSSHNLLQADAQKNVASRINPVYCSHMHPRGKTMITPNLQLTGSQMCQKWHHVSATLFRAIRGLIRVHRCAHRIRTACRASARMLEKFTPLSGSLTVLMGALPNELEKMAQPKSSTEQNTINGTRAFIVHRCLGY